MSGLVYVTIIDTDVWPHSGSNLGHGCTHEEQILRGKSMPNMRQVPSTLLKYKHKHNKLNLRPIYQLTFKCDLDLQPTRTIVSNGTSAPPGEQLCQIILNSMHKRYKLLSGQAQFMTILSFDLQV